MGRRKKKKVIKIPPLEPRKRLLISKHLHSLLKKERFAILNAVTNTNKDVEEVNGSIAPEVKADSGGTTQTVSKAPQESIDEDVVKKISTVKLKRKELEDRMKELLKEKEDLFGQLKNEAFIEHEERKRKELESRNNETIQKSLSSTGPPPAVDEGMHAQLVEIMGSLSNALADARRAENEFLKES